jgi:branched-chain amino acid transport system substrate-binding protein
VKCRIVSLAIAAALLASSAQAQISDNVVKIGVLTDLSSLYSDATGKGSVTAVQMAVEDFGGKVRGQPIEVISADHQNKPDVGSSIARDWYDSQHVDAIVDVPTSSNGTSTTSWRPFPATRRSDPWIRVAARS